ncbi:MAG TPA: FAD-dependent oxidoreductase, partial [Acidobacteria bacterium]|nr:FAD-dependent oxidoreductase [Acidobacteriota bacterium]
MARSRRDRVADGDHGGGDRRRAGVAGAGPDGGQVSVVVLGGGLAGLAAAHALEAAGRGATVLEAGDRPGGACRSFTEDGFTFDLTGHLLHVARHE